MANQTDNAHAAFNGRTVVMPCDEQGDKPFHTELDSLSNEFNEAQDFHQLMNAFITGVRRTLPCDGIEYEEESINLYLLDGDLMPSACHYNLGYQQQALGRICFSRSYDFTEDELVMLETMLSGLVLPLRNALRSQQAIHIAQRDALTGLRNSSCYHDNVEIEIKRARRYGTPFSLILIDIDNFKKINDQYGRESGDELLTQLARSIESQARSSDIVFRNGGDEFLVFLPNTGREQALTVAERIKRHTVGRQYQCREVRIAITLSAGVATIGREDDAFRLFSRADKALFHAKILGKNQIHAQAAPEHLLREC